MPDNDNPNTAPTEKKDKKGFIYRWGRWWPAWAALLAPFLVLLLYLYRVVREEVDWKAAFITVAAFEIVLFPAEYYALTRGWWVYNEARILGPKILGVPIEEPFLYYFFSPLFVITLFHAILKRGEHP